MGWDYEAASVHSPRSGDTGVLSPTRQGSIDSLERLIPDPQPPRLQETPISSAEEDARYERGCPPPQAIHRETPLLGLASLHHRERRLHHAPPPPICSAPIPQTTPRNPPVTSRVYRSAREHASNESCNTQPRNLRRGQGSQEAYPSGGVQKISRKNCPSTATYPCNDQAHRAVDPGTEEHESREPRARVGSNSGGGSSTRPGPGIPARAKG